VGMTGFGCFLLLLLGFPRESNVVKPRRLLVLLVPCPTPINKHVVARTRIVTSPPFNRGVFLVFHQQEREREMQPANKIKLLPFRAPATFVWHFT
jgi:hypothetical protein